MDRPKRAIHTHLTPERWQTFSLDEQLGNVGSEVSRAIRAKEAGNQERMDRAIDRALELLDLTISDPHHRGRRSELCRVREVFLDYIVGHNEYGSTAAALDRYFLQFATAAQLRKLAGAGEGRPAGP